MNASNHPIDTVRHLLVSRGSEVRTVAARRCANTRTDERAVGVLYAVDPAGVLCSGWKVRGRSHAMVIVCGSYVVVEALWWRWLPTGRGKAEEVALLPSRWVV